MDVPLVEFVYLVFTCMPGESYRRRLRSLLLDLGYVFRAPVCVVLKKFLFKGVLSPSGVYNFSLNYFPPTC